jgi:hypothetical protein
MRNDLYDESNGLWYTKVGDYYLPNLVSGIENEYPINRWGRARLNYLKNFKRVTYTNLKMRGKLNEHLHQTEEAFMQRYEILF